MRQSESLVKLAEALTKAQAMIKGALKDSSNPHFRSDYADLESVWEAARGPLTSNGLSVVQGMGLNSAGKDVMVTTLLHSSGEFISSETPILLGARQDMQALGSAITYARRYALAAIAGIAPKDDDGELAVGRGSSPSAQKKPELSVAKSGFRKEKSNAKTEEDF